ncbi:MAG: DUF433 domain-containing protein [Caldilineaceae bacterium]
MIQITRIETLPIVIDTEIMSGVPVFAGTRVPVRTLFDYLMDGCTLAEFLDNFPTVSRSAALVLLEYAAAQTTSAMTPV